MKLTLPSYIKTRVAVHVSLTLLVTVVISSHVIGYTQRFVLGITQQLNWDMASAYLEDLEPNLGDSFNRESLLATLQKFERQNPSIDLYLLSDKGEIVLRGDDELPIAQDTRVATESIETFVRGKKSDFKGDVILGMDPAHPGDDVSFSAAELRFNGSEKGYLYTILFSKERRYVFTRWKQFGYIIASCIAIVVIIIGVVSIVTQETSNIKKSVDEVNKVLEKVIAGDFSAKVNLQSSPELEYIGASVNEITDILSKNIQKLKYTDRMRRELVSNISHDLNTPLSSASGYIRRLIEHKDTIDDAQREKFLDIARQNLEMLEQLISDLFEFSKLDSGAMEPERYPFPLLDVITEEVFPTVQGLAEDYNISLRAVHPENVRHAFGDGEMITRVISNLVVNAIRYNKKGGEVVVEVKELESSLEVSVSDTGIGIPPTQLPRIFDRFYRADEGRKKGSGSGLGLAIAKKILSAHNEEIEVKSEVNVGTIFTFSIEIAPDSSKA